MSGPWCRRWLVLALCGVVAPAAVTRGDDGQAARRVVEEPEVRVCHREVPWSPGRVGRAGPAGASFFEPWTVATMDVRKPLTIGATEIDPGCYAWVCSEDENGGPVMELRRLRLPAGTLPDPEDVRLQVGESLFRMPLVFDTARGTSPHLTMELSIGENGLRLKTRYGDGEAETTFQRR